jgi:hypothetical protein
MTTLATAFGVFANDGNKVGPQWTYPIEILKSGELYELQPPKR